MARTISGRPWSFLDGYNWPFFYCRLFLILQPCFLFLLLSFFLLLSCLLLSMSSSSSSITHEKKKKKKNHEKKQDVLRPSPSFLYNRERHQMTQVVKRQKKKKQGTEECQCPAKTRKKCRPRWQKRTWIKRSHIDGGTKRKSTEKKGSFLLFPLFFHNLGLNLLLSVRVGGQKGHLQSLLCLPPLRRYNNKMCILVCVWGFWAVVICDKCAWSFLLSFLLLQKHFSCT